MAAPNFDAKQYHQQICGVPGIAFEQNGCYYNIRGEYVKSAPRRKPLDPVPAPAPAVPRAVSKTNRIGAAAVPDGVVAVSQENDKALRAEAAAD